MNPQPCPQPLPHGVAESLLPFRTSIRRRVLRANQQIIHRLLARDQDLELTSKPLNASERIFNCAGVDVFAPHDEHVIVPTIDTIRKPGISAATRARSVYPTRAVVRD